jgi:hypothetical protein
LASASVQSSINFISESSSDHVSTFMDGDNSAGSRYDTSRAIVDSDFGFSQVAIDLAEHFAPTYPWPDISWAMDLTYVLEIDNGDTLTSTTLTAGNPTNLYAPLAGIFTFTYDVSYEVRSTLVVNAASVGRVTSAATTSMWTDVFTFRGGASGTTGIATFDTTVVGSMLTETTFAPFREVLYPGDWRNDYASLAFTSQLSALTVPDSAVVVTGSGTAYKIQQLPEASSGLYVVLALAGLGACKRFLADRL